MTWQAIAGGAVLLGAVWGVYELGHAAGQNACEAATAREERIGDLAATKASESAASAIAANRPHNTTIRQETEREIRTNTIYADCRHSAEQLRRVNDALTGRADSAGGGQLP